jgi:hypothetical protein
MSKQYKGHACLPTGRCYRWSYDPEMGFTFRGPGLSKKHQPGKFHPVWKLVEQWAKSSRLEVERWLR